MAFVGNRLEIGNSSNVITSSAGGNLVLSSSNVIVTGTMYVSSTGGFSVDGSGAGLTYTNRNSAGAITVSGESGGNNYADLYISRTTGNPLWTFSLRTDGSFLYFGYNGSFTNSMRLWMGGGSSIGPTAAGATSSPGNNVTHVSNNISLSSANGLTPTARLHVQGGTTTVSPLRINSGSLLDTATTGSIEFDATNFYGTVSGPTRKIFAFTSGSQIDSPAVTASFISAPGSSPLSIGTTGQVLVLSGGAASSSNPRNFSDVNFFVSGALGSAGTSTRGTSLFGGDAFISGSLTFGGDSTLPNATSRMVNSGQYAYWQNWYPTNPVINLSGKFGASLFMFQLVATDVGISGKLRIGSATTAGTARLHITASSGAASTAPLKFDSGSLMATPEAGAVEYDATNLYFTSGTTRQVFLTTLKNNAAVTSSFIVSTASNMTLRVPGGGSETNRAIVMTRNGTPVPTFGNDAFLFVTGTAFSKDDASDRGVAVFAGDVVMSGSLWGGYQTFGGLNTTRLNLKGGQIILGGGGAPSFGAPTPENSADVAVFVSGALNSKGGATRGLALVGGDLHVSGNTHLGTVSEAMATTGSALQGTLTFNTSGQSVFYVSGTAGNITANFTNVPVFDGRIISTNVILSQSSMGGGIVSAVQINSVASTILWANGVTPTANAGKHDVFGFSLIRSGTVWTTLGQMSTYG